LSNIWLNEGFASYMEYVALQNLDSQSKANYWMYIAHNVVKEYPDGSVYIPDSLASNEDVIFDYRLQYKKGASILHTLRYEIDDYSLFFEVLRTYLSTYAFSVASSEDFKQIAEQVTGMNFTDFFNQWYYGEGYPIFYITWNQNNDTVTIISDQSTSTSITPLFKTHFDLKLNYATGDTIIRLFQDTNFEIYKIHIPYTITSIYFDPNFWLINVHDITLNTENKLNNPFSFQIYPNPAKNNISIISNGEINLQNCSFEIYDVKGQLIKSQRLTESNTTVDVFNLIKGVYIIKIINDGQQCLTTKLIKE